MENRLDLLLYLISKVESVESMPKLSSVMYRLNKDIEIFPEYTFQARFLTRSDRTLEGDVAVLVNQRWMDSEPVYKGLVSEDILRINRGGKNYLKFFKVSEKLEARRGDKLQKAEDLMVKYNSMSFRELLAE